MTGGDPIAVAQRMRSAGILILGVALPNSAGTVSDEDYKVRSIVITQTVLQKTAE